jgi:predicted trehalose synthase
MTSLEQRMARTELEIQELRHHTEARHGALSLAAIAPIYADTQALRVDVADVKTDVAGLKTDVAVLKTDMAEVKGRLDRMETLMRTILDRLPEPPTKGQ